MPEIKLGLLPGAGGSQRLARLLPAAIASVLVNQVVDDGADLAAAKRPADLGGPMALDAGIAFERETVAMLCHRRSRRGGGGIPRKAGTTLPG